MTTRDPGGPLVAVCAGTRCSALWRLQCPPADKPLETTGRAQPTGGREGGSDFWSLAGPAVIRDATVACAGGVLVRLDCTGGCAAGAVVVVAARTPGSGAPAGAVPLTCMDQRLRLRALQRWLSAPWTGAVPPLPPKLAGVPGRPFRVRSDGPGPAGSTVH